MAKSPSFRLGTNSLPMRVAIKPLSTTATAAAASTTALAAITRSSSGPYQRLACTTRKFSVSLTRWPMNRATAAGMKVTDRIMAPERGHHRERHRVEHLPFHPSGQRWAGRPP